MGLRKGRKGSGLGQRQVFTEDFVIASKVFGADFVRAHQDAIIEGRTKISMRDLAIRAQKKLEKK